MAIYGYTRISTNSTKQDNTRQINKIIEYLKSRGINSGITFFNDEITGKTFDRPQLNKLMDVVAVGDEVVIYQLDRLGRKKEGIKEALETFKRRGVIVRVLDIPTTLQDFTGMDSGLAKTVMELINNLMIEIAGAFAEAEAERISSRVKEGMAVAKAKGKQIGNSTKTKESLPDNFEYFYELIQSKKFKKKEIAKQLRVSDATLWRYCKLYEGSDVYKKNAEAMRKKRTLSTEIVKEQTELKKEKLKAEESTEWIKTAEKKLTQSIKRKYDFKVTDEDAVEKYDVKRNLSNNSLEYLFKINYELIGYKYLKNEAKIQKSLYNLK